MKVRIFTLAVFLCALVYAYPTSDDIPSGPSGVSDSATIGGAGMTLSGSPDSQAPVIAMMNAASMADETLVATGSGLDGVQYCYALDGDLPFTTSSTGDFLLSSSSQRSMVVLPDNSDFQRTTLVFAYKDGKYSAPFRINGPEVFWISPSSVRNINGSTAGNTLRIYGRNLDTDVSGTYNVIYISGPSYTGFKASFVSSNSNMIEYSLPDDMTTGTYDVWVHNGTGKSHGWSNKMTFTVYNSGTSTAVRYANAPSPTPSTNRLHIQSLIDSGGTVELQSGVYVIDQPLIIDTHYVTLKGASWGSGIDYKMGTVTGSGATVIKYDGSNCLEEVIKITHDNVTVRNLVLMNGHDGGQDQHQVIEVTGKSALIKYCRLVMYDERTWGNGGLPRTWTDIMTDPNPTATGATSGFIDDGCIFLNREGEMRAEITSCCFYTPNTGIRIGTLQNADLQTYTRDEPSKQIYIIGNTFEGYYRGEPDRQADNYGSGRATGIVSYNGREILIKANSFSSYDRDGGRLMNRSFLSYNSANRYVYITGNNTVDTGTAPWAQMPDNQGEQYLFHYRYTKGGIFDALSSTDSSVTIDSDVPAADSGYETKWYACDQRGGWVPSEVGSNDNWVAMIVSGQGVGQWRQITSKSLSGTDVTLNLAKNWRLKPDTSSKILLYVPQRHNILRGNQVNCGIINGERTHLCTLWNECLENIVVANNGYNLSSGITVNSAAWMPCAWNLIEGNYLNNMAGDYGGLTTNDNTFIAYQFATTRENSQGDTFWPTEGWYGVGNIARYNEGYSAQYGFMMDNSYFGDSFGNSDAYDVNESLIGKGMQMCISEHNDFDNITKGLFASCVAHYCVIRENDFDVNSSSDILEIKTDHDYPKTQIVSQDNYVR